MKRPIIARADFATGSALWAAAKVRVLQWNRIAASPSRLQKVQEQTLLAHVRACAPTEFGRAHHFDTIRSYADYAERVPLRIYADFEPYLERMRKGERNILYPGFIEYYGHSSGSSNTTAAHKYLPISPEQIRWQQRAGFDIVARYLDLSGDKRLTGGYMLGLLPPALIRKDGPVGISSNPGLMQLHMPSAAKMIQLPQPPVRDIEIYDQKLNAMAEAYLDYDVRGITGTTCWFSIFFDRLIATARARGRNVSTVAEIWPNLHALFGGGVHAGPYRQIINERMGRPITLIDNYNATEGGLFAATDRSDDHGMLMIPDRGVFFEFVLRADHGRADAKRVPLWKVEPGVDYSIAVTTASGLFSYYMGDVIRFNSVFPHRMEFAGRTGGVLSVTQELTSFIELERAVSEATRVNPCSLVDFTASSEVGIDGTAKGRYLFFVEFDRAPADLQSFTTSVDKELCLQNRVYREHRAKDVAILSPVVIALPKGSTGRFMQEMGMNSVQNKFPRIIDQSRRELLQAMVLRNQ
ncbi:MAG: putative auxin-regulated protein [Myxococcaceae bacterium]|nr:putative auxin-regulated protein [Myxococcaceae bacterium]